MELSTLQNQTSDQQFTGQQHQVIVFKLGHEEYGLLIDQIKEVVITPDITHVPLNEPYVIGVANIRGNILAIIDLEAKFGLNTTHEEEEVSSHAHYTLVVESREYNVGILVKEVPNTLNVFESQIDFTPNIVHEHNVEANHVNGVVKVEDRLIILVDIFRVLEGDEAEITKL